MSRKGYKDISDQLEADKRYLKNNPAAKERKRISILRSQAKRYIRENLSVEEYDDFIELINVRMETLKGGLK